jgi:hypothetical protein
MATRDEIAPDGDERYIRRDDEGEIETSVKHARGLSDDARQKAETNSKPGQGDRGDHHARSAFRAPH